NRATEIGCAIYSIAATEPQLPCSSIIQASRVTCPSRSGYPARPTVWFFISASGILTPASTASKARPPVDNVFQASLLASTPKFQVEITIGKPGDLSVTLSTVFASALREIAASEALA